MTLSDKIAVARNAKDPPWSQRYLAEKLAGQLGKDFKYWYSRLRNIETRYRPTEVELVEISEALGTDYDWQATEDDRPVQWRREYEARSSKPNKVRSVPNWGYLPSWNWSRPEGEVETVSTTYNREGVVSFKLRTDRHIPRFRPGMTIYLDPANPFTEGTYCAARSPEGEIQIGLLKRDSGRWIMHFPNPAYAPIDVDDWESIGQAVHTEETDDGGLTD